MTFNLIQHNSSLNSHIRQNRNKNIFAKRRD